MLFQTSRFITNSDCAFGRRLRIVAFVIGNGNAVMALRTPDDDELCSQCALKAALLAGDKKFIQILVVCVSDM